MGTKKVKPKPKPQPQPEYYINCVVKILTPYRTSMGSMRYYDHIYERASVKVIGVKAFVTVIGMGGHTYNYRKIVHSHGFTFEGERVTLESFQRYERFLFEYTDSLMRRLANSSSMQYRELFRVKRKKELERKIKRNIDTLTGKIVAYDMTDDTTRKMQILDEIVLSLNKKYLRHFNINVIESMIRTYMQHGTFEPSTTTNGTAQVQATEATLPF